MTTYYNYLGQPMAVSDGSGAFINGDPNGGVTITAPPGPVSVSVNGGNWDTLIAGQGDDTFYVNNITDVVQAAAGLSGVKTIVSYSGGYTLPANIQNLTFYGAGNWGAGNAGNNLIVMGGNDANVMDGGGGNDVLVGGFGENDFQFEVNSGGVPGGHDVVYNFHPNLDTVRIAGASFTSFAQIQSAMQQVGPDVVLTIDANDSITFRNTTIATFRPSNFLLPLDTSQLGPMTFDDEFNSLQLWNGSTGHWQTNFGGDLTKLDAYAITSNTEKQLYTAPNFVGQNGWNLSAYNPFSISNGVLDITAGQFSYADSQHTWGQAYYSGMLNTRGLFMQQYGFFEIRAALPTDLGSWPAFWLSQDPYAPGTEADILEHLALYPDVDFERGLGGGTAAGHTAYMPKLSGFHNYGMLWTPTTTTFYIDDLAVMSLPTPSSWTKPMYMILDMALGGWGGPIDATALPATMQIDWIHVYGLSTGGGTGGGGTGGGGTGGGGTSVTTSASPYTAPTGVTDITLTGSRQVVTGNNLGDTFHSNNTGNYLTGGTGNDVFDMGRGGDWATGGGGNDVFAFAATPWAAGGIADFNAGDTIDLTGLLHASGYAGSDPVGAGYIKIVDDGAGGAQIWSNLDKVFQGYGWYLVTDVQHVAPAQLQAQGDLVVMAGSGGTGGGGTGGGGTGGGGTGGTGGTAVTTSASPYTVPAGVTDVTLTGSQQVVTGNSAGDTFHSNNSGNYLTGGTGNDTFDLGRGGDWATGGGGNDVFAFAETPWAGGGITDFNAGDKVDLTGLLARSGYTGANAIGAGYIKITDDGSGDAQIWSNLSSTWWLVTTVQHVPAASLHMTGAFISE
jgi:beta-glucanase (GH16 family)